MEKKLKKKKKNDDLCVLTQNNFHSILSDQSKGLDHVYYAERRIRKYMCKFAYICLQTKCLEGYIRN